MSRTLVVLFCLLAAVASIAARDIDVAQLKSHLPAELATTNFTMDDAKNLLRFKCRKTMPSTEEAEKAYEEIEKGTTELTECLSALLNVSAIQTEIEIAKPIGELDTVFVKYCSKRPEAMQCVDAFNAKVQPCLDAEERAGNVVMMRVVNSIFNFVCYKGGDQIALFYAEKGPECFEENKEEIGQCLNNTFGGYVQKNGIPDLTQSLPKFVIGPKQCGDMYALESCILSALVQCEEITPSNIAESLFRFVKNETQCPNVPTSPKASKSGSSSIMGVLSVFGIVTFAVLQRFVF